MAKIYLSPIRSTLCMLWTVHHYKYYDVEFETNIHTHAHTCKDIHTLGGLKEADSGLSFQDY